MSWVVSLWQSPLTFVWPGVPKQPVTTAPSSSSERHLTVFCINEIVLGPVVYLVNTESKCKQKQPELSKMSKLALRTSQNLYLCSGYKLMYDKELTMEIRMSKFWAPTFDTWVLNSEIPFSEYLVKMWNEQKLQFYLRMFLNSLC